MPSTYEVVIKPILFKLVPHPPIDNYAAWIKVDNELSNLRRSIRDDIEEAMVLWWRAANADPQLMRQFYDDFMGFVSSGRDPIKDWEKPAWKAVLKVATFQLSGDWQ